MNQTLEYYLKGLNQTKKIVFPEFFTKNIAAKKMFYFKTNRAFYYSRLINYFEALVDTGNFSKCSQ